MNINEMSLKSVVSQVEGQIVSDMGGEKVMLSIPNGKYYNLGAWRKNMGTANETDFH